MSVRALAAIFLGAGLLVLSCGPVPSSRPATTSPQASASGPTTLVVALPGEPRVLVTSLGLGNQPNLGGDVQGAVHRKLATLDDLGQVHPQLAVELPSQERGTWTIRPDGTMQTIYRLRRDVTWHDGVGLTARDFVFAATVTTDPELPLSLGKVSPYIGRIDTPDDYTLSIEWTQTYPFANGIVEDDLGPLPAHLLEAIYQTDKERLEQLPYWTREFIGVGPYRVAEWELGSHMVLRAYDAFYEGRPRIDTLVFRFIESAPTAVANLLAGTLDGAIPQTIDFQQAMFVKAEWERAGRKPVVLPQSVHWRTMAFQLRPEVANPRDLLDVRVRRALVHAIDRKAIVDTLFDGVAPISDAFLPPDDFRSEWVRDAVARYDYDPRRAQDLLTSAGWRRGPDGWTTTAGLRAIVPQWTTPGYETEVAIIADNWKAIGLGSDQVVLSPGEARDRQYVASFPAVMTTTFPISFQYWVQRHHGAACSTEANRWVGNNRGCYLNPERDRIANALNVAIDPSEQRTLYRELARVESEDVPALPLYFNVQLTVFRDGVTGVKRNTSPKTTATWNVTEWDIVR